MKLEDAVKVASVGRPKEFLWGSRTGYWPLLCGLVLGAVSFGHIGLLHAVVESLLFILLLAALDAVLPFVRWRKAASGMTERKGDVTDAIREHAFGDERIAVRVWTVWWRDPEKVTDSRRMTKWVLYKPRRFAWWRS